MTRSCIPFVLLLLGILAGILITDRKAKSLEKETMVVAISDAPIAGPQTLAVKF